jgi:tetratricopeptide (TPR) repeat protein
MPCVLELRNQGGSGGARKEMNVKTPLLAIALAVYAAASEQPSHETTDQRIRSVESHLRLFPKDRKLCNELIILYLQKVRETADPRYLDLASKLVETTLGDDVGNLDAFRLENEIDLQRHDFKAVSERSSTLLRYNRSDPAIWGNFGDASMELGEYEHARDAYTRMFALRPNLTSYNRLAWWYFVNGDLNSAIVFMRQAIDAGSATTENVAWCWAELGDIYFKAGSFEHARTAYETALKLFPSLHRAWAGSAKIQAAKGDFSAAINSYKRAQSIVPMVEYSGALEDLYTFAGSLKQAEDQKDMTAAMIRIGRERGEKTNRNLAILLADHNRDLDLALALARAEIQDRPDVYTWDALSWVLFKSGNLAEAVEASRRALRLSTPEPMFYYHASVIAGAAEDEVHKQQCEKRLAALNPHFDVARCVRAALPARESK